MKKNIESRILLAGIAAVLALFCTVPGFAQSTWDGGGANANWDTGNNWVSNSIPALGADVIFATAVTSGTTISLNGNRTVSTITIGDGATTNYQIGDTTGTLNLTSGVNYTNTAGGTITLRPATIDFGSNNTTWAGNGGGNFMVRGNLTGSGTITKQGNHTLRLSGNNSGWTGGLVLEGGNVNLDFQANNTDANNIFGTGSVTFSGNNTGVQNNRSGPEVTWSNAFINDNSAAGGASNFRFTGGTQSGGVVTIAGAVSTGANTASNSRLVFGARVGFNDATRAEGRWNLSGDWSGYSPVAGSVAIAEGTLQIDAQQAIAPGTVTYAFNGTNNNNLTGNSNVESGITTQTSKLILDGAYTMANNVNFSNASNPSNLAAGEAEQSVGATHTTGTAEISGNVNLSNSGATDMNLFSQESGAKLLISGDIGGTSTTGTLQINNRYAYAWGTSPPGSHQVAWRNPDGTVELTGNNTYQVNTVVEAGLLLVNNTVGSGTGSGEVTVMDGAGLGGSGTIGGNTTIQSGGTLSPGNSAGIMTYNSGLTLSTGSTFNWELVADSAVGRGMNFDGIDVTGGTLTVESGVDFNLVFNDTGSTVDFTTSFWDNDQSWLVFDNAIAPNVISGSFFNLGSISADPNGAFLSAVNPNGVFSFSQSGNDIYLNYAVVVPEPSTAGVLALFFSSWLTFFRRRRKLTLTPTNG